MSEEDSNCVFLLVLLINLIFETGTHYYFQVCLEQCKYIIKDYREKKLKR